VRSPGPGFRPRLRRSRGCAHRKGCARSCIPAQSAPITLRRRTCFNTGVSVPRFMPRSDQGRTAARPGFGPRRRSRCLAAPDGRACNGAGRTKTPGGPETHGRRRRSKHCAAAIRAGQVPTTSRAVSNSNDARAACTSGQRPACAGAPSTKAGRSRRPLDQSRKTGGRKRGPHSPSADQCRAREPMLRGIRRTVAAAPDRKAPLLAKEARQGPLRSRGSQGSPRPSHCCCWASQARFAGLALSGNERPREATAPRSTRTTPLVLG
jgi:hypothetical protein